MSDEMAGEKADGRARRERAIDGWQGLAAILGVWLGLIPLVRAVFDWGTGILWRQVLGDDPGTLGWLGPAVMVVAAVTVVALLERKKQR